MNIRPFRHIERRKSRKIKVGDVFVGGDAPITVQTMTNTLTTDVDATLEQIFKSVEAGADIIRISCPDKDSTKALKKIVEASSGQETLIISAPASTQRAICSKVASTSVVKVLVIV